MVVRRKHTDLSLVLKMEIIQLVQEKLSQQENRHLIWLLSVGSFQDCEDKRNCNEGGRRKHGLYSSESDGVKLRMWRQRSTSGLWMLKREMLR